MNFNITGFLRLKMIYIMYFFDLHKSNTVKLIGFKENLIRLKRRKSAH